MERTTPTQLDEIARHLSRLTGRNLVVEWAYSKPRLMEVHPNGDVSDISPRLPSGELARWMWAFEKGLTFIQK